MTRDADRLSRRSYLKTAGVAAAGTTGLAGCVGDASGTLATHVTDRPGDIEDFQSCVVTIVGVWLGPDGASAGDEGEPSGREYHELDEPEDADLVDLQDGTTRLIDERDLATGEYAFLQLDVDGIDATLDDGESATVEVPGDAPLTFHEPFEIRENTRTTFTADFTPVSRGQAGSYVLQPVAEGTTVEYGDA